MFGEFCLVDTLCSFVEAQLACLEPRGPDHIHELLIFQTDSVHRAMGIVGTAKMIPARGEFDPDWGRLLQSKAITLQGHVIQGDIEVTELLFDVACHLGLPCDAPLSEQTLWYENHTLAMHWVARLLYQGSLAQMWYILGSCLFGETFPMQLSAPQAREGGQHIDITIDPGEDGGPPALTVAATVVFAVRDTEQEDLPVVGELPLRLSVQVDAHDDQHDAADEKAFLMSAAVQLKEELFDLSKPWVQMFRQG